MSGYQVVVPSYRRADILRGRTLATLRQGGVDMDRVTVFLHADDPERDAYAELDVRMVVTDAQGLTAQRAIIAEHYGPDVDLVSADDDLSGVYRALDSKTLQPMGDVDGWLREAFAFTRSSGLHVWGVSAVANPYFMRPGSVPSTDLKFLIGSFWGCVNRPGHPVHSARVEVKDDYELSLLAWWYDGGVVRFNDVVTKADHYDLPGGCQAYRDPAMSERATATLLSEWPGLIRRNPRRKSGHAEVLLSRRARHDGHPVDVPPPGRTVGTTPARG